MESPYHRPLAADLIGNALYEYDQDRIKEPFLCGYSLEMAIYTKLKEAGYLTESAQELNV